MVLQDYNDYKDIYFETGFKLMTIKIYKPSKTAMQSGFGKTKKWLAEYISQMKRLR